jgi:maltooligosyltrehalose trehalohydrolase
MSDTLGATCLDGGRCRFEVWAPRHAKVELHLLAPEDRYVILDPGERGYHRAMVDRVSPGALYFYRLSGNIERADPASSSQPQGVHGPSEVTARSFAWRAPGWRGIPLTEYVLYELHVGTYTAAGTFDAIIPHLAGLRDLGITAVELMPVAQFPGRRNWGYDGVFPFAVQHSYGGPEGLKRLVDACHEHGLAVALDVVYNHLGPEGNYLRDFGPYFTARYQTPWGGAINFDGAGSDEVRRFVIENALYWVDEFRIDGLRLDAVHAIFDCSPTHILQELGEAVHARAAQLGRTVCLLAESDLNDARLVRRIPECGYGLDAEWADDFHHALHTALTGERAGYYADFGRMDQLATAFRQPYVYSGGYSTYRQRRHGNSPAGIPPYRFVVFSQNHDQAGNRMMGERLPVLAPFESLKVAAAAVILSPYLPLLFMGEEYAETAPFLYFVEHSNQELIEAVRVGRSAEFASFAWQGPPPDPQSEDSFLRSKLDHGLRTGAQGRTMLEWYRELLRLRRGQTGEEREVIEGLRGRALLVSTPHSLLALNFDDGPAVVTIPPGNWRKALDSAEERWLGLEPSAPARLSGGVAELGPRNAVYYVSGQA